MAEEKKSGAEKRYGGKEDKKPEPRAEEKKLEGKTEGDGEGEAADKKADDAPDMRAAMVKRHEKEMRDLQGQHRDAMRAMHGRQADEASQMMQQAAGAPDGDQGQMPAGGGEAA